MFPKNICIPVYYNTYYQLIKYKYYQISYCFAVLSYN